MSLGLKLTLKPLVKNITQSNLNIFETDKLLRVNTPTNSELQICRVPYKERLSVFLDFYKVKSPDKAGIYSKETNSPIKTLITDDCKNIFKVFGENSNKLKKLYINDKGKNLKYIADLDNDENIINLLVFDNMHKTKTNFKMNKSGDVIQVNGDIPSKNFNNIKYDRKNSGIKFSHSRTENHIGGEHKFETVYFVGEKDLIKSYRVENCWLSRTVSRFISIFENGRNSKSVDYTVYDYSLDTKGNVTHKSLTKWKFLNERWTLVNK